ncbi:S8 family serine peptidase [Peribacillus psychrosaccharolyticus]|uniref:S8 family serine peptidase n=1 Tax=Peribacillus psychrosaccharolyticus TaxID=1407 RepID=A0A974NK87_PERPY|nr:S8 family serine peptidase [Peribacillus psychrosaccharolyticus]MEC2055752.1 S8 family serine peptidase [Peribacillus psychrosaccharolyticus]MED3743222.1 S8 family serine peptidase [Peribacillus psychrosaccharolyticus]QQS99401.1 S8 family serine peptidase [Peribacillus psychrosaccharolyticus]
MKQLLAMVIVFVFVLAGAEAVTAAGKRYVVITGTVQQTIESKESALKLAKKSGGQVYEDKIIQIAGQQVGWGVTTIKAKKAWNLNYNGKGVKIGIIDTGVDTTHKDLRIAGGKSFIEGITSYRDNNGHGTHVAGIIGALDNKFGMIGVAPKSELYALKALNKDGTGYVSDVIDAINWCIDNKMDIINLSMGINEDIFYLKEAVDRAAAAGIVVVAAAGNEGKINVSYPARYPSVIGTGALKTSTSLATFSNRGSGITVTAPGYKIYSTLPGGFGTYSGTSMAAPFVTGTLALYKQATGLSGKKLAAKLTASSIDLGTKGKDSTFGYGRIQAPTKKLSQSPPSDEVNGRKAVESAESYVPKLRNLYNVKKEGMYYYFPEPNSPTQEKAYKEYTHAASIVKKVKNRKVRAELTKKLIEVNNHFRRINTYKQAFDYAQKLEYYQALVEDDWRNAAITNETIRNFAVLKELLNKKEPFAEAYGPSNRTAFYEWYYKPAEDLYTLIHDDLMKESY